MKTYNADTVCEFLNKNIKSAQKLSDLLNAVDIRTEVVQGEAKSECQYCHQLKIAFSTDDNGQLNWNCKNCRSRCGYHNSLTGLYRSHFKTISPNDAGKILIDKFFGNLPETTQTLKLRGSNY